MVNCTLIQQESKMNDTIIGISINNTQPGKPYTIKVAGIWFKDAIRTRSHWNISTTGAFIAYDSQVEDVQYFYECPNSAAIIHPPTHCFGSIHHKPRFLVNATELIDMGGIVLCEYCNAVCTDVTVEVVS